MAPDDEVTAARDAERRLRCLLERARQGDESALPTLREALDMNPELWRGHGDLAAAAEESWVRLICGVDLVAKESLLRRLVQMRVELGGPSPSPLVKLLVDRIAVCWLQVSHADAIVARPEDLSLAQAKFAEERQTQAHRRYLAAISALTTTQRLIRPATTSDGKNAMADISPEEEDTGPSLAVVDMTGVAADSSGALRTPRPERSGRSA